MQPVVIHLAIRNKNIGNTIIINNFSLSSLIFFKSSGSRYNLEFRICNLKDINDSNPKDRESKKIHQLRVQGIWDKFDIFYFRIDNI